MLVRLRYLAGRGWLWLTQGGVPVSLPCHGATAADDTRRAAGRRNILRRWPLPLRPLVWAAMFPGWIWGAWVSSGHLVRAYPAATTSLGRGRIWRTALRHSFSPREVVEYGLCAPATPPAHWFCEHEMFGIWERLSTQEARAFAGDKLAFAGFCANHALPHAQSLAVWNKGSGGAIPTEWPDGIALKPAYGNNAQGFEAWERQGDAFVRDESPLSLDNISARGAALSLDWGVVLAQPLLALHPDLIACGLTGMPVARLITGQWPDGRVELFDAYFSAPPPGAVASNAGFGPKWPIEITDGSIVQSRSRLLPTDALPRVAGTGLPEWVVAVTATTRAHALFPHRVPVLGWDVAFTDRGPVLLETNTGISLAVPQGTRQRPAGQDPIAALVDVWLGT